MKLLYKLIILLCVLSCKTHKSDNLEKYINGSIEKFIEENNSFCDILIIERKPGVASSLLIEYPDSLNIELFLYESENMSYYNNHSKATLELLKKESISFIIKMKGDSIITVIPDKEEYYRIIY